MSDLSYAAVDEQSVDYDWSEHEWGTDWEYIEARLPEEDEEANCNECDTTIYFSDGEWHHSDPEEDDHDPEPDSDWEGQDQGDGPMMNYYYPVPGLDFTMENARKIADLPLCLAQVDGDTVLALTGGGMDLTWQICDAYIRLGYYPPFHFCQPPRLAQRWTERQAEILDACRASARVMVERAEYTLKSIDRIEEWYHEQEEK